MHDTNVTSRGSCESSVQTVLVQMIQNHVHIIHKFAQIY